ncbi:hypothetical protein CW360_02775 [Pseudomonas fluvialis]|uniref:Uncharacterized protein n=1 Tax=Pseudomonas fluvialis TaxID=1793966 RepID=A0A2I0CTK5_9PSED|nr:hypothetical protein [Pseudomonas pharmacofabricae]PKF72655.1 hypothetical protein CW360_02775 [Pseudomonas pharmacofabricae]
MLTAPQLAWTAAGCPRPNEKYKLSPSIGICSTCGTAIDGEAVAISEIDSKAFSNHSESFRFGGTHTCLGCAWMYGMGKGKPGNYIAVPARFEQAVISLESVVEDKRPWLTIIREIADLPPDTPVSAVLTTDVKIRLWARARLATVGRFGLYVHCPDYDISQHIDCDLRDLLKIIDTMLPILRAGFAKASIWYGLYRDHARMTKNMDCAPEWESQLQKVRGNPAFLPALLMAGITKEEKTNDAKRSTAAAHRSLAACRRLGIHADP